MSNKVNNENEHNITVSTPEVLWHGGGNENGKPDPVYSVDYHTLDGNILCTTGIDASIPPKGSVRLWKIDPLKEGQEFLLDLCDHQSAVNVARFSPDGKMLASASNRQIVIYLVKEPYMWQNIANIVPLERIWLRPSLSEDIFDLQWSPDSTHVIIGAIDSKAEIIRISTRDSILLPGHSSYVQGVTWDPRNEMVITQSADRSCKVHMIKSKLNSTVRIAPRGHIVMKMHGGYMPEGDKNRELTAADFGIIESENIPNNNNNVEDVSTSKGIPSIVTPVTIVNNVGINLFADSFVPSFFRRLSYTPDGALVICPTGIHRPPSKTKTTTINNNNNNQKSTTTSNNSNNNSPTQSYCTHIFAREYLNNPCVSYVGLEEPSVAVRCFNRPYKLLQPKYTNDSDNNNTNSINTNTSTEVECLSSKNIISTSSPPLPHTVPIIAGEYRFVFAVATINSIFIYDTQHACPIAKFSGLHYAPINDLAWSEDGKVLVACSSDGYLSFFRFKDQCLGELLEESEVPEIIKKGQPCLYKYTPPAVIISTTTTSTTTPVVVTNTTESIEVINTSEGNQIPINVDSKDEPEVDTNIIEAVNEDIKVTDEMTSSLLTNTLNENTTTNTDEKKKRKRIQPTLITSITTNSCSSSTSSCMIDSIATSPMAVIDNNNHPISYTNTTTSSNSVVEMMTIKDVTYSEESDDVEKENIENINIIISSNNHHELDNIKEVNHLISNDNHNNLSNISNNEDENQMNSNLTDSQKKKKRITPILIATYTGSSASCSVVVSTVPPMSIVNNSTTSTSINN